MRTGVIVVAVMLSVFAVLGTVGNALVLYVFGRRKQKLTSTTMFIVTLAITDFTISLFIMPFTVYAEIVEFKLGSDILCRLYTFCITFFVSYSCFIMVAIAFDRYFGICHPFSNWIDIKKTRVILFGLVLFSCLLGVLTSFITGISGQEDTTINSTVLSAHDNRAIKMNNNATYSEYTKPVDTELCRSNFSILSQEFVKAFTIVYDSFYIISFLSITVLYGFIYRYIRRSRAHWVRRAGVRVLSYERSSDCNNGTQKSVCEEPDVSNTNVERGMRDQLYTISKRDKSAMSNMTRILNTVLKDNVNYARQHGHIFGDENRLDNLKTGLMLFVVTAVFIIFFMPAWLMSLHIIPYNIIVFYLYFVHHFSNPFIYGFLNESFTTDLKRMFFFKL